jgi:Flp pilus assembly protein TadG
MQLGAISTMHKAQATDSSKGQGLVEFALVLPISLLVVMGIVVFGLAFARLEAVENAASEGARAAQRWMPGGSETCLEAVDSAIARSTPFSTVNAVTGACPADTVTRVASGSVITIQVTHSYSPVFFGTLFRDMWEPPSAFNLAAEVSVLHE